MKKEKKIVTDGKSERTNKRKEGSKLKIAGRCRKEQKSTKLNRIFHLVAFHAIRQRALGNKVGDFTDNTGAGSSRFEFLVLQRGTD